jgi:hypothetical protein
MQGEFKESVQFCVTNEQATGNLLVSLYEEVPAFLLMLLCDQATVNLLVWCHVVFVRTDVSEERVIFIIRVERSSELGTVLAVTSNWTDVEAG